jgi:hypothetical protein
MSSALMSTACPCSGSNREHLRGEHVSLLLHRHPRWRDWSDHPPRRGISLHQNPVGDIIERDIANQSTNQIELRHVRIRPVQQSIQWVIGNSHPVRIRFAIEQLQSNLSNVVAHEGDNRSQMRLRGIQLRRRLAEHLGHIILSERDIDQGAIEPARNSGPNTHTIPLS